VHLHSLLLLLLRPKISLPTSHITCAITPVKPTASNKRRHANCHDSSPGWRVLHAARYHPLGMVHSTRESPYKSGTADVLESLEERIARAIAGVAAKAFAEALNQVFADVKTQQRLVAQQNYGCACGCGTTTVIAGQVDIVLSGYTYVGLVE